MDIIKNFIANYNFEIVFGLVATVFFLFILTLVNIFRISSMKKKYNKLVKNVDGGSLEEIIMQHVEVVDDVKIQLSGLEDYCNELDSRLKLSLQKIGFIRYNAFNEMGSDLSFSIALLDDNLSGFVITSIYGREECNTYAKSIENGKSKYNLSTEEMQAIDRAIKANIFSSSKSRIS